jgi:hypothetical protein
MVKNLPECSSSQLGYSNSELFHPHGFYYWLDLSFNSYMQVKGLKFLPASKWYGHKVQKMVQNMKPSKPGASVRSRPCPWDLCFLTSLLQSEYSSLLLLGLRTMVCPSSILQRDWQTHLSRHILLMPVASHMDTEVPLFNKIDRDVHTR